MAGPRLCGAGPARCCARKLWMIRPGPIAAALRRSRREMGTPLVSHSALNVQVPHVQRVFFDELAAALDVFAHEGSEDLIALHQIFERNLEQRARLRVHRSFPELLCVHLTEAL